MSLKDRLELAKGLLNATRVNLEDNPKFRDGKIVIKEQNGCLGLPFAAMGLTVVGVGVSGIVSSDKSSWNSPEAPFGFTLIGGVFASVGISLLLWRNTLILDLSPATYFRQKGFVPRTRTSRGNITDSPGIFVRYERRSSGKSVSVGYYVYLLLPDEDKVELIWHCDAQGSLRFAQSYARELGLPCFDGTNLGTFSRTDPIGTLPPPIQSLNN